MAVKEQHLKTSLSGLLAPQRLWQGLRSMTFAIIMLTTILLIIVAGSFMPQDSGIRLVYQSWWFYGLNLVLMVSVLSCISRRASGVIRFAFRVPVVHRAEFYRAGDTARELSTQVLPATAVRAAVSALRRAHYRVVVEERDGHYHILADRFRAMRLGTLVSHTSIVLLVASIAWGALAGWLDKTILLEAGGPPVAVGHGTGLILRSDSFDFGFYPNGTPRNFRDQLTLTAGNGTSYHQVIDVNTPWYFGGVFGIDIHQASYAVSARLIALDLKKVDPRTGQPAILPYCVIQENNEDCSTPFANLLLSPQPDGSYFPIGSGLSAFYIPSRNLAVTLTFHDPVPMARLQATAVVDVLQPPQNGQGMRFLKQQADLTVNTHAFRGTLTHLSDPLTVKDVRLALLIGRVTGLNIGHNPAVPFIFTAFALVVLGMASVLYFPFSRLWLYVAPAGDPHRQQSRDPVAARVPDALGRPPGTGSVIMVRGSSEKSKQSFRRRFDELVRAVHRDLQQVDRQSSTEGEL